MLTPSLPCSLADLLKALRPCFTAPTFRTFQALVGGFLAQPGLRTVTGMLVGAGLAGRWHHARAHRFFAAARWQADQLGLAVGGLIVARLLDAAAPIRLVADDSLFKRTGRKVFGAGWHYDATAAGRKRTAWGNNLIVVGVLVRLPFVPHRMVCLPVPCRLWQPRRPGHSKLDLACELVGLICQRHPDRQVHLACDGAYAGKALRGLPQGVTVTTRLRADAALYQLPPPRRPGQRGRPRRKGARLAEPIVLAAQTSRVWQQATVACYGKPCTVELHSLVCLWYAVFGARPVRVILVRQPGAPDGYDLALVSTDLAATPAKLVERYADRWSVEVLFEEARQVAGVGQARNRTPPRRPAHRPLRPAMRESGRVLVRPARPASRRRRRPPRPRALVSHQARCLAGRHAPRAPPRAAGRSISAISAGHAHRGRTPPCAGSRGCLRGVKCETRVRRCRAF
jgi:hypothetical protein